MVYLIEWNNNPRVVDTPELALQAVKDLAEDHPGRIIYINNIRRDARTWIAGGAVRIEDYCRNRPPAPVQLQTFITGRNKHGKEVTYLFKVIDESPLRLERLGVEYRWSGDRIVSAATQLPLLKKAYIPL